MSPKRDKFRTSNPQTHTHTHTHTFTFDRGTTPRHSIQTSRPLTTEFRNVKARATQLLCHIRELSTPHTLFLSPRFYALSFSAETVDQNPATAYEKSFYGGSAINHRARW